MSEVFEREDANPPQIAESLGSPTDLSSSRLAEQRPECGRSGAPRAAADRSAVVGRIDDIDLSARAARRTGRPPSVAFRRPSRRLAASPLDLSLIHI